MGMQLEDSDDDTGADEDGQQVSIYLLGLRASVVFSRLGDRRTDSAAASSLSQRVGRSMLADASSRMIGRQHPRSSVRAGPGLARIPSLPMH